MTRHPKRRNRPNRVGSTVASASSPSNRNPNRRNRSNRVGSTVASASASSPSNRNPHFNSRGGSRLATRRGGHVPTHSHPRRDGSTSVPNPGRGGSVSNFSHRRHRGVSVSAASKHPFRRSGSLSQGSRSAPPGYVVSRRRYGRKRSYAVVTVSAPRMVGGSAGQGPSPKARYEKVRNEFCPTDSNLVSAELLDMVLRDSKWFPDESENSPDKYPNSYGKILKMKGGPWTIVIKSKFSESKKKQMMMAAYAMDFKYVLPEAPPS